jgi:hypothetical protein
VAGEDRLFHSTQLRPRWQPRQQVHCQLPTHSLHFFNSSGLRHDIYARCPLYHFEGTTMKRNLTAAVVTSALLGSTFAQAEPSIFSN